MPETFENVCGNAEEDCSLYLIDILFWEGGITLYKGVLRNGNPMYNFDFYWQFSVVVYIKF